MVNICVGWEIDENRILYLVWKEVPYEQGNSIHEFWKGVKPFGMKPEESDD